jgi:hypothetical protein
VDELLNGRRCLAENVFSVVGAADKRTGKDPAQSQSAPLCGELREFVSVVILVLAFIS